MYRVVIGDDLKQFRRWLKELLNDNCNFQVVGEAATGGETLQLSLQLKPDLTIVDLEMPDLDGLEVAKALRHQFPEGRVVLVSNHSDFDGQAGDRAGVSAFIPKEKLSREGLYRTLQEEAMP